MCATWLIRCIVALILYSVASAKNYDAASNEFSKSNNRFDRSLDINLDYDYGQFPPPPPLSMLPRSQSNFEESNEHNSVESRLATKPALYQEKREFPGSQSRFDASNGNPDFLSTTRRGSVGTSDLPIHYDFPATSTSEEDRGRAQRFSSARRDKITAYMSSTVGKIQVVSSSSLIGGGAALFIAKVR